MFSNFIYRIGQWLHENRRRVIRILLILAAILLAVWLIAAGVGYLKDRQYQRRVKALEKQFRDADERAKAAESRADSLAFEIEARKAELSELQAKSADADAALKAAQGKTKILKEAYETIRYVPVDPATPVSVDDACARLAELGYECK